MNNNKWKTGYSSEKKKKGSFHKKNKLDCRIMQLTHCNYGGIRRLKMMGVSNPGLVRMYFQGFKTPGQVCISCEPACPEHAKFLDAGRNTAMTWYGAALTLF